jgi:hypothetical protein
MTKMRKRHRRNDFATSVARSLPVVLFLVFVCLHGLAQSAKEHGYAERFRTIDVEHMQQMRKDVDAWPLIVHPGNAAERSINATLANLNKKFARKVQDCISGKFAWSKDLTPGEWERTVRVTMQGPLFLSMTALDGFYCGDAHPDDDLVVLVFSLETGEQVDWSKLVDKSAGASLSKDELGDEDGTPPLVLPELKVIYAAAQEGYCQDYFNDKRSFVLWPDAESGTLIAEVAGLPHVALPCKNELKMTIEQARKLGFDESLLQAIEESHLNVAGASKARRKQPSPAVPSPPHSH